MLKPSRFIIAVAATLCVARADAQTKAKAPALDAELEISYSLPNGQQFTKRGHFYRSKNGKIRQESGLGAMITDIEKGTVTLLIGEKNEARVLTIPKEMRAPKQKNGNRPAIERFEETTVDGHRVVKSRGKGPKGETQEIWTAEELGIVMFSKVEAAGLTTTQRLKNVKVQEPDASLFEVPKHYKVVNEPLRVDANRAAPRAGHPLGQAIMVQPAAQ